MLQFVVAHTVKDLLFPLTSNYIMSQFAQSAVDYNNQLARVNDEVQQILDTLPVSPDTANAPDNGIIQQEVQQLQDSHDDLLNKIEFMKQRIDADAEKIKGMLRQKKQLQQQIQVSLKNGTTQATKQMEELQQNLLEHENQIRDLEGQLADARMQLATTQDIGRKMQERITELEEANETLKKLADQKDVEKQELVKNFLSELQLVKARTVEKAKEVQQLQASKDRLEQTISRISNTVMSLHYDAATSEVAMDLLAAVANGQHQGWARSNTTFMAVILDTSSVDRSVGPLANLGTYRDDAQRSGKKVVFWEQLCGDSSVRESRLMNRQYLDTAQSVQWLHPDYSYFYFSLVFNEECTPQHKLSTHVLDELYSDADAEDYPVVCVIFVSHPDELSESHELLTQWNEYQAFIDTKLQVSHAVQIIRLDATELLAKQDASEPGTLYSYINDEYVTDGLSHRGASAYIVVGVLSQNAANSLLVAQACEAVRVCLPQDAPGYEPEHELPADSRKNLRRQALNKLASVISNVSQTNAMHLVSPAGQDRTGK